MEWTRGKPDYALLPTVARSGMTFEVGACPWGCLVADRYAQVRRSVYHSLCLCTLFSHHLCTQRRSVPSPYPLSFGFHRSPQQRAQGSPAPAVRLARHERLHACRQHFISAGNRHHGLQFRNRLACSSSRGTDESCARQGYPMVHPSLQDRDFELLQDGDPIFMNLEGGCKLFARSDYENIRDLPKIRPPSKQQPQLQNDRMVEPMAVSQVEGADPAGAMERGLFPFFINEVTLLVHANPSTQTLLSTPYSHGFLTR